MANWEKKSQGENVCYVAKIETENLRIYMCPSHSVYFKGWDITIYHFDDEIGFIHLDGEKVTDETFFAVAEKMVADFMEIESCAWQRRKREWLNGDDK